MSKTSCGIFAYSFLEYASETIHRILRLFAVDAYPDDTRRTGRSLNAESEGISSLAVVAGDVKGQALAPQPADTTGRL